MIIVSISSTFFGESLTPVGKPAPPRPTIPEFLIISSISSLDKASTFSLSVPKPSTALSSPSFSIIMQSTTLPLTSCLFSIPLTVPETLLKIDAEIKALASAIS